MGDAVSNLLDHRREEIGRGALGRALAVAVSGHLLGLAIALLAPALTRKSAPPPRFVAVQIVPAARLGVERPRPAPAPEKPRPEPAPEPPAKTEAPVLPDPEAKPRKVQEPTPAPPEPAPEPELQGSATGATSGLSLGAAVAGFDNPSFTYGYYVDQMLAMISSNWNRPPVGSGVEATLYFRIERDGRIRQLSIARSSGINAFDLAALRAVQASSPLPPLPRAFREESLGVNLIVR